MESGQSFVRFEVEKCAGRLDCDLSPSCFLPPLLADSPPHIRARQAQTEAEAEAGAEAHDKCADT